MASHDSPDMSLQELELELEPLAEQVPKAVTKGRAKFQIDTRGGGERRKALERRADIRFQEDRRSNKDRRVGSNPWAPGVDI